MGPKIRIGSFAVAVGLSIGLAFGSTTAAAEAVAQIGFSPTSPKNLAPEAVFGPVAAAIGKRLRERPLAPK